MTSTLGGRLREAALWIGAGLGLLSLLAGVAVTFFGFTFLIFRSGSMGPEIPTGSLALARTTPAAELAAGDVVSVVAANGDRITHRLVSSTLRGDEASLILQGDANGTPDEEIYQVTQAERSLASVPFAGYVVTVLLTPAGLVAVGCLSGMFFLLGFGSRNDDDSPQPPSSSTTTDDDDRHRGGRHSSRRPLTTAAVMSAAVAVTLTAGIGVNGTLARFTDQATATSPTEGFSAATVAVPGTPTVQRLATNVTISWSPETPVGAAKVTAYQVLRFTSPSGGTGTVACTTTAPTLTCTDTAPLTVTAYYQVRARIGTNWINDSARTSFVPVSLGPSVTFVGPPRSDPYTKRQDMQTAIETACAPIGASDAPACGRATAQVALAGVKRVVFQLERRENGTGERECYDGNKKWSTTCAFYDATLTGSATSTTRVWYIPPKSNDAYKGATAYSYVLSIIATDTFDNVGPTQTYTFSYLGG